LPEHNHIEAAIIDENVYLKPIGLATQDNCLGIPDFVDAMLRAGCTSVSFDLKECLGMDSTFLGVVAGAATATPHVPGRHVVILNAGERAVRVLQRVGLLPLVCLHEGAAEPPANIELRRIDFVHLPRTERERLERIKELHLELARLNEKNLETFGPFIEMLNEELQANR
jgi:anti-sigma B factor antagonist